MVMIYPLLLLLDRVLILISLLSRSWYVSVVLLRDFR